MKILPLSLILLFGIYACTAIVIKNKSGGKNHGFSSASSSSSSSSEEGKKHGHGHHHHNHGRPSRPRPTRPPRAPACPSDWMTFDRPQGKWCFKAFYARGAQSVAEAKCKENGAVLTGFQNADERIKAADALRKVITDNGGSGVMAGLAWVGGRRNAACPWISCGRQKVFEWSDGHTSGSDGFQWGRDEPNSNSDPCLQMVIALVPNGPTRFGYLHGELDEVWCGADNFAAACGKLPE